MKTDLISSLSSSRESKLLHPPMSTKPNIHFNHPLHHTVNQEIPLIGQTVIIGGVGSSRRRLHRPRFSFHAASRIVDTQRARALVIPGRFFGHHGWKYHPRSQVCEGSVWDEPCVRRQVRTGPSTGGHS